jgi:hypothetical protein
MREQPHSSDVSVESYCFSKNISKWIHPALVESISELQQSGLKWNFLHWFLRISSSITPVAIPGHSLPFCIQRKQGDVRSTPAIGNFLIMDSTKASTGKRRSRSIAPLNPNIGTKGRWVVSLTFRLLYCLETAYGAHWMGDWFSPTTDLYILITKCFPYRESNFDSTVVQPAALSLNQLRYTHGKVQNN